MEGAAFRIFFTYHYANRPDVVGADCTREIVSHLQGSPGQICRGQEYNTVCFRALR
jgi:hypothetical protein